MKCSKVYTHHLAVEPFQVDYSGHIFPGVLGNHMLGAAGIHAEQRGFGIARLNNEGADGYTWVLSRLTVEMESEWPVSGDDVCISTWINSVQRFFTSRCFDIKNENGDVYGYARSVWAMINLRTRHPEDLMKVGNGSLPEYVDTDRPCPCSLGSRIRIAATMPVNSVVMSFSDLDINRHVNSFKYIDHILDLFTPDFHDSHALSHLDVAFVSEAFYGDRLDFYLDTIDEGLVFNVEARRAETVVCRAHLVFKSR